MSKHTPGPWYFDHKGYIWRRPVDHLYEYGGGVAGDKPIATINEGWYGENEKGYPILANSRLIAAAPELLEALLELIDIMQGTIEGDYKPDSFTLQPARAAIAKATGGSHD